MKKRTLWLGLSFLLVAALVLASCGPAGEQEEEEEEEEEEEGEPQYGGTLTRNPADFRLAEGEWPPGWETIVWEPLIIEGEYLEDSFEYDKTFTFPENWYDPDYRGQMKWWFENPGQKGETSTEQAFTGTRSAKLWNTVNRSAIVAADLETWSTPQKGYHYHFFFPAGEFDSEGDGVYLNIDLLNHTTNEWFNALGLFNRFGTFEWYIRAYSDGSSDWLVFDNAFPTLEEDTWYSCSWWVDFDKWGIEGEVQIVFEINTGNLGDGIYRYGLKEVNAKQSEYKHVPGPYSAGAYYLGAAPFYGGTFTIYFDDVICWIGE